jgi:glycosyltransferase involved in cell wall biosynthesis
MINMSIVKMFDRLKINCMKPNFKNFFHIFRTGQVHRDELSYERTKGINSEDNFDIRNTFEVSNNKNIIMYYGSIEKNQGIITLLKAYKNLKSEIDNIFLIICGTGNCSAELENYVKENNLEDVRIIKHVGPEKSDRYLWQCDVIVLPSRSKSKKAAEFNFSIYDAARYCKPIIASSEIAGARDIIVDGENGFIVDEGSVDALHAAIGIIATNQILLKRMKETGINKP